jgi:hypothetical protein
MSFPIYFRCNLYAQPLWAPESPTKGQGLTVIRHASSEGGWRWVVKAMSQPLHSWDRRHPLYSRLGGTKGRFKRVWKKICFPHPNWDSKPSSTQKVATPNALRPLNPKRKSAVKPKYLAKDDPKSSANRELTTRVYSSLSHQAEIPIADLQRSAINYLLLVDLRRYSYTHSTYELQTMEQKVQQGRQYRIIR